MRISAGSSFQWFFSLLIWSVFSFGYRRDYERATMTRALSFSTRMAYR